MQVGIARRDITPKLNKKVWIAGFYPNRAAEGIHSNLYATSLTIKCNNNYVIFTSLDLVGLLNNRIEVIKSKVDGIDKNKLLIACIHNHQGPDIMGLWGENFFQSGIDKEYLDFVCEETAKTIIESFNNTKEAKVRFGKIRIRDISGYYNGKDFGGKHKVDKVVGLINDLRDPIIVDDLLLTMQFVDKDDDTIATFIQWTSHPEVMGENNTLICADYVHYLRKKIEELYGGICIYFVGAVGGMMTSLDIPIPIVDEEGKFIYKNDELVYAEKETWEATKSLGYIIAYATREALKNIEYEEINELKITSCEVKLPIENAFFQKLSDAKVFEFSINDLPKDECGSPCMKANIYYVRLANKAEFLTIPGEILPELVVELPEDFIASGSRPNKYFPSHNIEDELSHHANPFVITTTPIRRMMKSEYKFIIGLCDNEIGYIIPPIDFKEGLSLLENFGNHYEETMSLGKNTAPVLIKKIEELMKST